MILTSTDRTKAARFWLLAKLMATLMLERTYMAMLPLSPDVPVSSYHVCYHYPLHAVFLLLFRVQCLVYCI
jgi:hypothetical protein